MKNTDVAGAARFADDVILAPGMETLLLLLVCLSPWALEGAEYELWLYVGLGALLVLWAARIIVRWRFSWRKCPVALALAVVFLGGTLQLVPLPKTLLAWLSPATARMYDRLLPLQAEVLSTAESADSASALGPDLSAEGPVGATISLYPDGTREALVRILAVFLLFVVVRNEIASPAALRRLSVAVLVNGALLSLFGLVQFFSSSKSGMIYWSIPSRGQVFGPFVNRNHFAFYINISIGLGLGLLFMRGQRSDSQQGQRDAGAGNSLKAPVNLFSDPASLWISGGLALMLSGVVFSLSRGGFIALLGAATFSLLLTLSRREGAWRTGAVLVSVAAALALLIWFGLDRVEARLATIWTGEALQGGRGHVLTHAWPLLVQFPLWGSGYGTFQYVEPMYLHTAADVGKAYLHAHNDYLEDLIEGGLIRLLSRLVAFGLIFRCGYRAFRDHSRQSRGALALGALFAFTTIVIHSFVEFGLYLPAIAVLATVVCANLCALGEHDASSMASHLVATRGRNHGQRDHPPAETRGESQAQPVGDAAPPHEKSRAFGRRYLARAARDDSRPDVYSGGGVAPLIGAATAVLLGWFLGTQGLQAVSVERYLAAAMRLSTGAAGNLTREIQYLRAAAALEPQDADLQAALAEAHFEVYKSELSLKEDQPAASRPGQMAPSMETGPSRTRVPQRRQLAADNHLLEALRHAVRARDLCPLLPRPNAWLAVYASHLPKADAPSAYLARAKFLAPMNPELWYLCGLQELADGRTRTACESWRRSLQLSDAFLAQILDESSARLDAAALLRRVLPERPRVLLVAAEYLYPDAADAADREPFLRQAIAVFDKQSEPLSAEDWRIKALVHGALEQPDEAIAAYRAALAKEPLKIEWRYEFAALLREQGLLRESRQEIRALLDQEPRHAGGRQLADVLAREAAEGSGDRQSVGGLQP